MLWLSYRYFLQLYQIDTEFHRDHHNSILNDMKRLCANYGIKMLSVHEVLNQHVLRPRILYKLLMICLI
jgi:hypothetical protein